jgi:hypothetical protein
MFVFDRAAAHLAVQAVVAAGHVGARIVHAVVDGLRSGAAGREVAVAEGAQRFAVAFVVGVEAGVDKRPRVRQHRAEVELGPVVDDDIGASGERVSGTDQRAFCAGRGGGARWPVWLCGPSCHRSRSLSRSRGPCPAS